MKDQISIAIKTFERPASVIRLLRSIEKPGLDYPVVVTDDSRKSSRERVMKLFPGMNLTYIDLPFDTGVSAGRNYAVDNVQTPYFVLCDDDFAFNEYSDLERALRILKESEYDILGGDFYNYIKIPNLRFLVRLIIKDRGGLKQFLLNKYRIGRYIGRFNLLPGNKCELLITEKPQTDIPCRCHVLNNFFIARTEAVRSVGGWDPNLKIGEHEDFFLRAMQAGLKVGYLPGFGTAHYPVLRSNYKKYRMRGDMYKTRYVQKHGFEYYVEKQVESGKILFEVNTQE